MSSSQFKPLQVKKFPWAPTQLGSEARYWKGFKHTLTTQQSAAPTCINFSPVAPHHFVVTNSLKLHIYNPQTNKQVKNLSRFKDVVHCATFRDDGKLVVAGDESGLVQLFDVNTKSAMRQFRGHQAGVHAACFAVGGQAVFSASDDKTVACWDVSTASKTLTLSGHEDYVRCATTNRSSTDVLATGSYDHTVRLWDTRTNTPMLTLQHKEPVQDLVLLPGGTLLVSASGNKLTAWDLLSGGKALHAWTSHSKAITSLCLNTPGTHLLSGSVDQMVKVYDLSNYSVAGTLRFGAPILDMALSPSSSHLVVGMADRTLTVRQRPTKVDTAGQDKEVAVDDLSLKGRGLPGQVVHRGNNLSERYGGTYPGTYQYFLRGRTHTAQPDDHVAESDKKRKLQAYDKYLKKFRYQEAFDAALLTKSPTVVVSMLEELAKRGGLTLALQGRDEVTLEPVVSFLVKYISNPRYAAVSISVTNTLLQIYGPVLGQSMVIDELFVKLRIVIDSELHLQRQLLQLTGCMDTILAMAMGHQGQVASNSVDEVEDEEVASKPSKVARRQ